MCLFGYQKLESDKACRLEIMHHLSNLVNLVKGYPSLYIDPEDYTMLRIRLHLLGSHDGAQIRQFFTPWTKSDWEKHPLDLDDEKTAHDMAVRDEIFANGPKSNDPLLPVRRIRIETVVAGLISEFDRYARKDERGDSVALRQWTDWKAQGGHPFGRDVDALHSPSRIWWVINPTYWVNSRIPHLKFIVESDIKDVSDRLLLQTELLAIIAATKHGLEQESLKRHMIIPHGRILLAYFDDGHLVIQKSSIYRFSGTNQEPFDLFLRYMAAGIIEKEDTAKYASWNA